MTTRYYGEPQVSTALNVRRPMALLLFGDLVELARPVHTFYSARSLRIFGRSASAHYVQYLRRWRIPCVWWGYQRLKGSLRCSSEHIFPEFHFQSFVSLPRCLWIIFIVTTSVIIVLAAFFRGPEWTSRSFLAVLMIRAGKPVMYPRHLLETLKVGFEAFH